MSHKKAVELLKELKEAGWEDVWIECATRWSVVHYRTNYAVLHSYWNGYRTTVVYEY